MVITVCPRITQAARVFPREQVCVSPGTNWTSTGASRLYPPPHLSCGSQDSVLKPKSGTLALFLTSESTSDTLKQSARLHWARRDSVHYGTLHVRKRQQPAGLPCGAWAKSGCFLGTQLSLRRKEGKVMHAATWTSLYHVRQPGCKKGNGLSVCEITQDRQAG